MIRDFIVWLLEHGILFPIVTLLLFLMFTNRDTEKEIS